MKKLLLFLLLLPLLCSAQISKKKAAFYLLSQTASAPTDTIYDWLANNARAFWDMTNGIDKTGNGYDLVGETGVFTGGNIQVPDYETFYNFDGQTKPIADCSSGNIPLLPAGHENLLRNSHEFHFVIESGRNFGLQYIMGVTVSTHIYYFQILNTGQLVFQIRSRSSSTATLTTDLPHFTGTGTNERRAYGQKYVRTRIDFEANTFEMWINGAKVAVTLSGDALVNWNPTWYTGVNPFAIGAANVNNSTANFQGDHFRKVSFVAVTDILTASEAQNLLDYLMPVQGTGMRVSVPTNPVFSTKSRITLGVKMDEAPLGTVDVTISGDYIDTINKTMSIAECTDGFAFSFFANNLTFGFKEFDITVEAVGYTDVVVTAYVSEDTEEVNTKWTPLLTTIDGVANWRNELPTFTNVATKREALANDIFRDTDGVYPTGAPYANIVTAGLHGVNYDNVNSATKISLEFRENDPDGYYWANFVGWSENSTPSTTLVIDGFGHGENGHQLMYDAIMDAGYDYASFALVSITNNPAVTESLPWIRHNEILVDGIEREGYDGRRLFMFDKIRALDYLLSQKAYTKIVFAGISGGGWVATLLGALDTRIDKTFAFRGVGAQSQPYGGGDYEQGPSRLFDNLEDDCYGTPSPRIAASLRNHSRLDMMVLCGEGGREFHWLNHLTDDCCWKGYYHDIVKNQVGAKITGLGGTFNQHTFTNPATAVHGYYTVDDIAYLLANIP